MDFTYLFVLLGTMVVLVLTGYLTVGVTRLLWNAPEPARVKVPTINVR